MWKVTPAARKLASRGGAASPGCGLSRAGELLGGSDQATERVASRRSGWATTARVRAIRRGESIAARRSLTQSSHNMRKCRPDPSVARWRRSTRVSASVHPHRWQAPRHACTGWVSVAAEALVTNSRSLQGFLASDTPSADVYQNCRGQLLGVSEWTFDTVVCVPIGGLADTMDPAVVISKDTERDRRVSGRGRRRVERRSGCGSGIGSEVGRRGGGRVGRLARSDPGGPSRAAIVPGVEGPPIRVAGAANGRKSLPPAGSGTWCRPVRWERLCH